MPQYIDKSALVAEIENFENNYKKCPTSNSYEEGLKKGRLIGYEDALDKINTLEVKEMQEEPVSEDLENVAIKYAQDKYMPVQTSQAFKAGAKWQKQQDQSTIELAEDHAMLAGMEKMKEEMMKGAVEGYVTLTMTGVPTVAATVPEGKYNFDDKVKLIIIKED